MKNFRLLIFTVCAIVCTTVIRFIQLAFMINTKNGFFYENHEGLGLILSVIIIVIMAISALFAFLSDKENINPIPENCSSLGLSYIILGFSQLLEIFMSNGFSANVPGFIIILKLVATILSGATFLYFGIYTTLNKKINYAYISVPISAWILRLVATFISYTGMSNISDNLYNILMLASTTIFLLFHGKVLCNIEIMKNLKLQIIFGTIAIISTAIAIIPRIIVNFFKINNFPHSYSDSPITSIFMAVYIFVYFINVYFKKGKTSDNI